MQTRKRAKSVTFGKKIKEKPEKESVKETAEEEVLTHAAKKVVETTDVKEDEKKETPKSEGAPLSSELSATPPKAEEGQPSEESNVATPPSEFVSDSPLSSSPVSSQLEEESVASTTEEKKDKAEETKPEASLSSPLSTEPPAAQPVTTPEPESSASASAGQSATAPQSAFTIQSNDVATQTIPSEGKKRFGLYFFIVALVSFTLGLGVIAAAGHFGLIKLSMPNLPMLASKPTPTLIPTTMPTAAPTEKPANLSTYTISVLNGSGITGKAGDVKASLTTAGYKVTSAGNADNSNYTKTEISAKSTVDKTYLSQLQGDLGKSFTVDSTVSTLPASSSTDVTVTIGSSTAQ